MLPTKSLSRLQTGKNTVAQKISTKTIIAQHLVMILWFDVFYSL